MENEDIKKMTKIFFFTSYQKLKMRKTFNIMKMREMIFS